MKFSNFFITYTTVLRLWFCTENCMLFGSPHVLHSSDKNTANQRKKPTNANVFNRFLYLLYLFMWVHLRVKRLLRMCTDTSRSLSCLDQIRVVTYVTSRTSRFIKKKSHRAIKDYLACCKNLLNNLRCSELFQAQTFLFLFFVISLFEKTSQWREEVNYICSLFFERSRNTSCLSSQLVAASS